MKKLKLDLDELSVESFQPLTNQPSLRGTVHANSCRWPDNPENYTQYWSTCDDTFDGATCHVGCPSYGECESVRLACDDLLTVNGCV